MELVSLIEDFNDDFKKKLRSVPKNAKYTSGQIQNEMISTLSCMVRRKISDEVRQSDHFSLMVDESKDIWKVEQISLVVRYYLEGIWGTIHERFLGFKAASQLNATSLLEYIKDVLKENNIDQNRCVAQTYDCASVMSGCCAGVQTLFRAEVPAAIYIHCYNFYL